MNEFVSNFLTDIVGKNSKMTSGLLSSSNTTSELLTRVRQTVNVLTVRTNTYDNLIFSLLQDASIVADKWCDTAVFTPESRDQFVSTISSDVSDSIYKAIVDSIDNLNAVDTRSARVLSIVDGDGYVYDFAPIDPIDRIPLPSGRIPIVAMVPNPSSDEQLIMWMEGNEVKFNNVIASRGWYRGTAPSTLPAISQALQLICDTLSISAGVNIGDTLDSLMRHFNISNTSSTIKGKTDLIVGNLDREPAATIEGNVTLIYATVVNPAYIAKTRLNSIFDVLTALMQTSAINNVIIQVSSLMNGSTGIAELSAMIDDFKNSKYAAVREVCSGLKHAFIIGGLSGVCQYIIQLVAGASSLQDDDGCLIFTDNKALVPSQYIAGMVTTIISGVAAVAGALLSVFIPVLGAVVTVAGGLGLSLARSISFDYSSTRAALNNNANTVINASPYGIFQQEINFTELSADLRSALQEAQGILCLEVIGGFLYIGAGSYNDKGEILTVRYEFHPSYESHLDVPGRIRDHMNEDLIDYLDSEDQHVSAQFGTLYWFSNNIPAISYGLLSELYSQPDESVTVLVNRSDDHLNDSDDNLLRQRVAVNIGLFLYSLLSLTGIGPNWDKSKAKKTTGVVAIDNDYASKVFDGPYNILTYMLLYDYPVTVKFNAQQSGYEICNPKKLMEGDTLFAGGTWRNLSELVAASSSTNWCEDGLDIAVMKVVLNSNSWYGTPMILPSSMEYGIFLPRYDSATFLFWIISSAIIAAVVTVATITIAVGVKKAIAKRRAINQASVEQAWNNFTKDPSPENYQAYKKAVKKNNLWATFIGGTKYDKVNYWNGDVSDSSSTSAGTEEGVSSFASIISGSGEQNASSAVDTSETSQTISFDDLKILIRGF